MPKVAFLSRVIDSLNDRKVAKALRVAADRAQGVDPKLARACATLAAEAGVTRRPMTARPSAIRNGARAALLAVDSMAMDGKSARSCFQRLEGSKLAAEGGLRAETREFLGAASALTALKAPRPHMPPSATEVRAAERAFVESYKDYCAALEIAGAAEKALQQFTHDRGHTLQTSPASSPTAARAARKAGPKKQVTWAEPLTDVRLFDRHASPASVGEATREPAKR